MSSPAPQFRARVPRPSTRIAEEALQRARLTVVPRARPRSGAAPRVPFLMLVSMVLLVGVVGLLLFNTNMQQASFHGSALEKEAKALAAQEQTLKQQVSMLRSPQRIATAAQRQGMGIPTSTKQLSLADGTVTGAGAPVTPQDRLRLRGRAAPKPADIAPRTRVVRQQAPVVAGAPARTRLTKAERRERKQARAKERRRAGRAQG